MASFVGLNDPYVKQVMTAIAEIGCCVGCGKRSRLSNGACPGCAARGEVWVERARKCRTNPVYALEVYEGIKSQAGRDFFSKMFGVPDGATPLGLRVVK